jgi:hypothetical protein
MIQNNEEKVAKTTVDRVINADEEEQAELAELYAQERARAAEELGNDGSQERWEQAASSIADEAEEQS